MDGLKIKYGYRKDGVGSLVYLSIIIDKETLGDYIRKHPLSFWKESGLSKRLMEHCKEKKEAKLEKILNLFEEAGVNARYVMYDKTVELEITELD